MIVPSERLRLKILQDIMSKLTLTLDSAYSILGEFKKNVTREEINEVIEDYKVSNMMDKLISGTLEKISRRNMARTRSQRSCYAHDKQRSRQYNLFTF